MKSTNYPEIGGIFFFGALLIGFMSAIIAILRGEPAIDLFGINITVTLFKVAAILFSSIMIAFFIKWTRNYSEALKKDFPLIVTILFFVAYSLLIISIFFSKFWPLCIATLLVIIMTINACCRIQMVDNKRESWPKGDLSCLAWGIVSIIFVVGVLAGIPICFKFGNNSDYLAIVPVLLIAIPRSLMGSSNVRKDSNEIFGNHVFFRCFSAFTCLCSGAYIGSRWLLEQVSSFPQKKGPWFNEKGVFNEETFAEHVIIIFVFMGLLGLVSFLFFFPKDDH